MNSRGDSRLTSAVTSRGLSPRQPDARDVCLSLGIGEQIGYGAAGFVDVTVSPRSKLWERQRMGHAPQQPHKRPSAVCGTPASTCPIGFFAVRENLCRRTYPHVK